MSVSKSAFSRYRIIDRMLRNSAKKYPTLLQIQETCFRFLDVEPSLNTLEKDIRNMKHSDTFEAPIKFCRRNLGYYYTDENYSINAIPLSSYDISSIKEALELVNNLGVHRVNKRFSEAIQKILVSFKEEFPEGNINRKIIQTDYVEGAKGTENFSILFNACKNLTPLSIALFSYSQRTFKSEIVHPIRLKEFENKWYLIAYSEKSSKISTYGFDRIYEPITLKRIYIKCPEEIVDSYCNDIYGVYPMKNEPKQLIRFITSIQLTNYFEAYPIHKSQQSEKNESGSSFFTINVVPSRELIRLFRSYGKNLVVIHPEGLKKKTESLL
ncbi:helix-turn-helix transcriptional regulator [Polaribacter tangerinus]|uniref:helix-turn-helix transcriptional regulator n=1 Tax=Polaribacter tangerinus TaxID=1920034 RepID=UPI000B4B31AC|nr:WYL domain-containing protein [Polaribacter tangerinus]